MTIQFQQNNNTSDHLQKHNQNTSFSKIFSPQTNVIFICFPYLRRLFTFNKIRLFTLIFCFVYIIEVLLKKNFKTRGLIRNSALFL